MKQITPPKIVTAINFDSRPEISTFLVLRGQRYQLLDVLPRKRRDGSRTEILLWRSQCAECGQLFECTTSFKQGQINRRCKAHSKRGIPVKRRRK